MNESAKPEECDCCQFETAALVEYRPNYGEREQKTRWLCDLCAGTLTSNWDGYSHRQGDTLQIMKTICYVGNAILAELRKPACPKE